MSKENYIQKIAGKKGKSVFMFTLSTCVWCKKTKHLLRDLGVEHSYIDVDLVGPDARAAVEKEFEERNKEMSFPTIVINDGEEVIVGFNEERIREILENE